MPPTMDESHRSLVEANIDLADIVASKVRTRLLTYEERLSAALYGLCLAALDCPEARNFRGYARRRAEWQIASEIRTIRRRPSESLVSDEAAGGDHVASIETMDEAESIKRHFARLTEGQREAMTLYCNEAIPRTARALDKRVRRSIVRLRKMARAI